MFFARTRKALFRAIKNNAAQFSTSISRQKSLALVADVVIVADVDHVTVAGAVIIAVDVVGLFLGIVLANVGTSL